MWRIYIFLWVHLTRKNDANCVMRFSACRRFVQGFERLRWLETVALSGGPICLKFAWINNAAANTQQLIWYEESCYSLATNVLTKWERLSNWQIEEERISTGGWSRSHCHEKAIGGWWRWDTRPFIECDWHNLTTTGYWNFFHGRQRRNTAPCRACTRIKVKTYDVRKCKYLAGDINSSTIKRV